MLELKSIAKPKAYSYLRFSSPEQMKGDSKRRQTSMAEEYARRNDLDLDVELTFQDLGVSAYRGKNAEAGRLADFLKAVQVGMVPVGSFLLVEALDRISRLTPRKALRVLEDIVDEGITLITLNDNRAYTSSNLDDDPTSLLTAVIMFMRANEESSTKARRLKESWKGKRQQVKKKPLTSISPAWVQLNKEAGQFELLEDRASVVKRIYDMYLEGVGQHSIATTLNEEKIAPFGRAAMWQRSYIKKILENPAVIGRMIPHEIEYVGGKRIRRPLEPVEGYYPTVVDEDTFQRVQSIRSSRYTPKTKGGSRRVCNLLAGLAKCPLCGSTMTRVMKGKKSKPRLVCTKAKVGADCPYTSVLLERVEEVIVEQVEILVATAPSGDNTIDNRLDQIEMVELHLREEIYNVVEAIASSPSPALNEKLRSLEGHLEELLGEREKLFRKHCAMTGPLMEKKCQELEAALTGKPIDKAKANMVLRQLLSAVVVDYQMGDLLFEWQQGGATSLTYTFPKYEAPRTLKKELS